MTDPITDNFLHKVSNKPILLVGPTASGKSKLAMSLAIKLKRHIVNADSVQVYSNWRILTARPTSEDEKICLLYTSPSPRDSDQSRMPSSA